MNVRENGWVINVTQFIGERLLNDFSQLFWIVRQTQIVGCAHLKSLDDRWFTRVRGWCNKMFALKIADGLSIYFGFTEVADNKVKFIQIVACQCFLALPGHDDFVAEFAEILFEESAQLIVVIHDENPAFFHPAPIYSSCRGEFQ